MLTFGHVHDLVAEALEDHFTEDPTMADANERARAARILVYLDRHVSSCDTCRGLSVDSEYSRVGEGLTPKVLGGRRVFPDLLIHQRTVQTCNLLAVEVKLREASRPLDGPDYEDSIKIEAMTGWIDGLPDGMEAYRIGLCLNLDRNRAEGWWTIRDTNVLHEHETFGSTPSPVLRRAFGAIVCEPG